MVSYINISVEIDGTRTPLPSSSRSTRNRGVGGFSDFTTSSSWFSVHHLSVHFALTRVSPSPRPYSEVHSYPNRRLASELLLSRCGIPSAFNHRTSRLSPFTFHLSPSTPVFTSGTRRMPRGLTPRQFTHRFRPSTVDRQRTKRISCRVSQSLFNRSTIVSTASIRRR